MARTAATTSPSLPLTLAPRRPLWARSWPWLAVLGWFAGLIALGRYGQAEGWSPALTVFAGLAWSAVPAVLFRTAVRNMFGPVFVYEVVRLGRKRSTFVLRLLYIFAVMALLGLMYAVWVENLHYQTRDTGNVPPAKLAEFASEFFYVFVTLQFAVVALLTPANVAGCIADEKERKTLEFLLATDLSGHEIVFGKLAARVLTLLMYVLAGLPVLAFLQLFGGIDPDLLIAGTAATVIGLLGLSAVSVYFSVSLKKPRDAIALTYIVVALYGVVSFTLAGITFALARQTGWGSFDLAGRTYEWSDLFLALRDGADWFAGGNILYAVVKFLETTRGGAVTGAGINAILLKFAVFWGVVSVAALAYAVARLRPIALHQAYGAAPASRNRRGRPAGAWRDRPQIGDDAMLWKEVFVEGSGRAGCLWTAVMGVIVVLIFIVPVAAFLFIFGDSIPVVNGLFNLTPTNEGVATRVEKFREAINTWARVATGVLGSLAMLGAAVRGSGAVSGERDRDTWISLISTPMTAWEMLRGKWLGVVFGLRRVYLALLAVWAIALLSGAVDPPMVLLTVLYLAVTVSAFAWLGIVCSIHARNTMIASVRAILSATFFGGGFWVVLMLCCCWPLAALGNGVSLGQEPFTSVTKVLVGATPPFVVGWLPLMDHDRGELWPFHTRDSNIGAAAPVIGLGLWCLFGFFLALLATSGFRQITNRGPDREPRLGPRGSGRSIAAAPEDGDE